MAKSTPLQFKVPGMKCDACVKSIEGAIQKLDPDAHVAADLETKRVIVGTGHVEAHDIVAAIEAAGFEVAAA